MIFAVTGANGFLGVHIIHHLLSNGHRVIAIVRPNASLDQFYLIKESYSFSNDVYDLLSWESCELFDSYGLLQIFVEVDYVLHVAGIISYEQRDFGKLIEVNKNYTANVANMALEARVKKLVYCSSISALSKDSQTSLIDENNEWDDKKPHSNYGLSKYLGECEIWRIQEEGLRTAIVIPGIILGYGNWNQGSNSLFKNANKQFRFYSKGVTGFVGVNDVAKAMCSLCVSEIDGERYILVSENLSFESISKMMAERFEKNPPSIEVKGGLYRFIYALVSLKEFLRIRGLLSRETVKASISENYYSNQKAREQLNIKFTLMQTVINDAISWYKKSPPK
ncbi:MAG: NAD-dependent epimerase/dehydratase family protein [Bacteroidia bacterium]|nr:NAD-dependent epimerase/dehydratase family protein [Bacteroidia bacterium]NNJ55199.1 NAD-dependent epimerase/dehydratase family protein [Bacteroidia bacterium]